MRWYKLYIIIEEKEKHVYRAEYNGKVFWFVSRLENTINAIKLQIATARRFDNRGDDLTEVQELMATDELRFDNVQIKDLGLSNNSAMQARLVINDMIKFNSTQVWGHKNNILNFALMNEDYVSSNYQLNDLLALMRKYPNVDFGIVETKAQFLRAAKSKSNAPFFYYRGKTYSFWKKDNYFEQIVEQNSLNKLYSLGLPTESLLNYEKAFVRLVDSNINKDWYEHQDSFTRGLIWYSADIDSTLSLLTNFKLAEQDCSERFEKYYIWLPFKPRIRDACSVPILISFNLRKLLSREAFVAEYSDDKSRIYTDPDLSKFRDNILDIYNEIDHKREKLGVFVKSSFRFEIVDIVQIYVRSPAEKLAFLTMLAESKKGLNIGEYANKIAVNKSFFDDKLAPICLDNIRQSTIAEMYPKKLQILQRKK